MSNFEHLHGAKEPFLVPTVLQRKARMEGMHGTLLAWQNIICLQEEGKLTDHQVQSYFTKEEMETQKEEVSFPRS
jgi:hypothetical protein